MLAEALGTLRSACEQGKPAQLRALRGLLDEIALEDRETVERAFALFERASCGFAECLIVARAARAGCDFSATFDRAVKKLPDLRVI